MAIDSFDDNWALAQKMAPKLTAIFSPYLVTAAPLELDIRRATDFVVIEMKHGGPPRIASRVRRNEYLKYKNEFTVRSKVPYARTTELDKLLAGEADWMFYGFLNTSQTDFVYWRLLDLHVWRASNPLDHVSYRGDNRDGTGFIAFRPDDFPEEMTIACSKQVQLALFE